MAFDYPALKSVAEKLIADAGRSVQLEILDDTPSDPNAPWEGNGSTPQTDTVTAVIVPTEHARAEDSVEYKGEQVAYVAATFALTDLKKYNHLIDSDGSRWVVQNAQPVKPGDTELLYTFELTR